MKTSKLLIKTKDKKYSIFVGKNVINSLPKIFKNENIIFNKCLLVTDKKVPKVMILKIKKKIKCNKLKIKIFNSSEKNKNYENVNKILNVLFKMNFNRDDCLVSIGGGITGDVVGFAASIYKRGIKFINFPTTLLSQVDSSIGGKTGVNNKYGKNLIGSFYQPDLVISETSFLKYLPKREIICGYGEILKHSLIADEKKFNFLEKNKKKIISLSDPILTRVIVDSCKIKKNVVERDEKEKNLRKVLNFGHTFAHAFEASQGYKKKLNHGEAVLLGIKCAVKFSQKNKLLSKETCARILTHIDNLNINKNLKNIVKSKNIIKFMKADKKNRSQKINLILLKKIGKPKINLNFDVNKVKNFLYNELN